MNTPRLVAQWAQIACIWEACAPKPGNINRGHDFCDTSLEDLLISAITIGPALETAGQTGIGQVVWQAVQDTRRIVHSNTNLGLVLLLAPLVKACLSAAADATKIRQSLKQVLRSLTVEDCRRVYAAIRLAQPGGMGKVEQADIAEEPSISLLEAMELARDRDSIAREYVTDFAITFEVGLPALKEARLQCKNFSDAIVQTFLTILSRIPDTLIARKRGWETAAQVAHQASEVLARGGVLTSRGRAALEEMDNSLRDANHSLNPGTTADLTAASLFLVLAEICGQIQNYEES